MLYIGKLSDRVEVKALQMLRCILVYLKVQFNKKQQRFCSLQLVAKQEAAGEWVQQDSGGRTS